MSRSYKHTPIIRYEKEDYHILNRKIRRNKNTAEIAPYSGYRRFSLHCNTWKSRWTKKAAIRKYYSNTYWGKLLRSEYLTLEDYLLYWKKCVYYK